MSARKKHPGGRPTKFSKATADRILLALRAGNYAETAAAFAGIDKTTFYDWLKKGAAQSKGQLSEFSHAVEKAMAEAEMRDLSNIGAAAGRGEWQASAWRLERKFPDRWGRRTKIEAEVGGKDGKPIEIASWLDLVTSPLKED